MYLQYPKTGGQAQTQEVGVTNPPTLSKKKYPIDVVQSSLRHAEVLAHSVWIMILGLFIREGTHILKPSHNKRQFPVHQRWRPAAQLSGPENPSIAGVQVQPGEHPGRLFPVIPSYSHTLTHCCARLLPQAFLIVFKYCISLIHDSSVSLESRGAVGFQPSLMCAVAGN